MPAIHLLPFTTFASIAELGLEVHVYGSKCFAMRRIDPHTVTMRHCQFPGARSVCRRCEVLGQ